MVKHYSLEVSGHDDELRLEDELGVSFSPGISESDDMFIIDWDAQTIAFSQNPNIKYKPKDPAQWGKFRTVASDNTSIMKVEIRQGEGKFSLRSSAHSFMIDFERVPTSARGRDVVQALMRIVDLLDGPSL